ncbi:helix-turn-helix transcriptional regulator [Burkholderia sp. 22PA0106]|uniref:helix-turn-helix transcriptional regulator n=1 Tax=Burkholderia sp. 22PA0106 TaxID=3237371 RepID=UPI0039C303D7
MNLAELGEAFREARLAANLTQQQVAKLSGLPRERISLFETGSLPELGAVKMLSLFDAVGLEILVRRHGHQRTLDDVLDDPEDLPNGSDGTSGRVRVRAVQRFRATENKS